MALLDLFTKTLDKQIVEKEEKALQESTQRQQIIDGMVDAAKAKDEPEFVRLFKEAYDTKFEAWGSEEEKTDAMRLVAMGARLIGVKVSTASDFYGTTKTYESQGWSRLASDGYHQEVVLFKRPQ